VRTCPCCSNVIEVQNVDGHPGMLSARWGTGAEQVKTVFQLFVGRLSGFRVLRDIKAGRTQMLALDA